LRIIHQGHRLGSRAKADYTQAVRTEHAIGAQNLLAERGPSIHGSVDRYRAKLHSTDPLERLNKEIKRRADVVGIFPGEASITRLIGAVLLEANDEWQLQQHYMQLEAMAEFTSPVLDPEPAQIPILTD
jgi:hypothetical protein